MACIALTKGRGLDCNRSSGGVKYIYFGVYDQFTAPIVGTGILVVNSEITDIEMGAGTGLYRYTVPRLSKEDQNEIKLLGQTQVVVFAQLNQQLANGHDVIVGLGVTNAMQLNAGTADSGTAFADRNGYTLNFDGFEADPFPMVADYTTNPFDNAAFTNVSITTS